MTTSTTSRTVLSELDRAFSKFDNDLRKVYGGPVESVVSVDPEVVIAPEPLIGKPARKEYVRPSGEKYIPRKIRVGSHRFTDVAFIEKAYKEEMPVLLFGEPGTGKTALVEAVFPDLVTVAGTIETETADFTGSWVQQPDGTYSFVEGPLLVAARNGLPILVDEVALIDPRVMSVVYSAMDGRGMIPVTANPEIGVVKVQPGFLVFGATNPDVPGAIMSEALLSRFTLQVEFKTDWTLARKLKVPDKIVQVARNLENKKKTGAVVSSPQLRELLAFRDITEKFGEEVALNNFVAQARVEDQEAVRSAIEAVFGVKTDVLTF